MPSLAGLARKVAFAERIPTLLFYTPLVLRWLWLGLRYRSLTLPTIANPSIEAGGFWGESKSACMGRIGPEQQRWVASFVTLRTAVEDDALREDSARAQALMQEAGFAFPIVAKPDIGWQGFGVRLLDTAAELLDYLSLFPRGERVILQRYIPFDGEAGVFYARLPGEAKGRIYSLTLRYFPYVVGDGQSALRDLILGDSRARFKAKFFLGAHPEHMGLTTRELEAIPAAGEVVRLAFIGSIRVGGLYRDGHGLITPLLEQRIDGIAQSMPEFWFGRFDVRFESIERLQQGEGFAVIEINGAGAEAIHAWDPEVPVLQAYRELLRAQTLLFRIASRNRDRGFKAMSLREFFAYQRRQQRLIERYPPSA
jgi:hypothetical protein